MSATLSITPSESRSELEFAFHALTRQTLMRLPSWPSSAVCKKDAVHWSDALWDRPPHHRIAKVVQCVRSMHVRRQRSPESVAKALWRMRRRLGIAARHECHRACIGLYSGGDDGVGQHTTAMDRDDCRAR